MSKTILIVGGTGLIGKTIHKMLLERNPLVKILIGTRKKNGKLNHIQLDVNDLKTFELLKNQSINLVMVCVRDTNNNLLSYAIKNKIDYIDITKPTTELTQAHNFIQKSTIESKIVFSSGWMGSIAPLLLYSTGALQNEVKCVKIMVYYSTKDKAGKSSADFMAENISKPFFFFKNNLAIKTKHFLNVEQNVFRFDNKKRNVADFDIPDLYIFNQIEKIPSVSAKLTFDSKIITAALIVMQKISFFKILMLWERKLIFGGGGKGDISSFEIIYLDNKFKENRIALISENGQSELTAFSTVLHIEKILLNDKPNGIYFSHQLHDPKEFIDKLTSNNTIIIK